VKLRAFLAATALALPLAATAASGPRSGGTLIAADPIGSIDCVNIWFICEGSGAAIVDDVIEGAFKVAPDLTYQPNLVSHVDLTQHPFAVTYFIRPQARWSDGVPVTATDFQFTFQALTDKRNGATAAQALYSPVRGVRILGARTVQARFRFPFAGWRDLFHEVLPAHALRGEDTAQVWKEGIDNPKTGEPIGDGPFLVSSLVPGDHLTVIRNPRYWARTRPIWTASSPSRPPTASTRSRSSAPARST
jgi:ABC-type transport system substrate-binding protein